MIGMADFDPSEHDVDKVVAYLEQSDDDERERVLLAESEGKDRKTIRDWSPSDGSDEPEGDEDEIHDFAQTEENAVHLLAAAKRLGLNKDVVTTKNGRLQAPESVVRAADITPEKD